MNVHHLELFYYVAKYEGITAAVRKMPYGIQQPAVSGQLLQLEKSLGVKLFNRRPFSLTHAGDKLYDHVYPFFSRLSDVEDDLKGGESQHLRIAASAAVLRNHLPELLADLRKDVPKLKLTLRDVDPSDVPRCLLSQQVDLAVSVINSRLGDGLKSIELMSLSLVLLLPEDHPAECFDDLLDEGDPEVHLPLVGLPRHEALTQIFQKGVRARGLSWMVTVEVDSLEGVYQFVRCGFGAGIGLSIPGMSLPSGVKAIGLDCFSPLVLGVIFQGSLKPTAQKFLNAAVVRSRELMAQRG